MKRTAFEQVALEWHHEKYVVLTRSQPARADEVAAWLRNHLFPFMAAHGCTSGEQVTRQMFIGFQDWVADPSRVDLGPAPENPGEMLTVAQAVARSGVSTSSVKRRLRSGGFPNAVQEARRWLIPAGDLHAAGLLGGPLRRGPRSLPKNHQQQSEMRKVLADILAFAPSSANRIELIEEVDAARGEHRIEHQPQLGGGLAHEFRDQAVEHNRE